MFDRLVPRRAYTLKQVALRRAAVACRAALFSIEPIAWRSTHNYVRQPNTVLPSDKRRTKP
ncbi:hypothetical protein GCM10009304_27600 [Pseudomonas matsuisoli]|uniref:Uncharacterized protein n=1 Tax=Pseudomonas matsuisoli TaxID=1515666 RepID=A0A917PZ41_9PSED|nr:hypothetical protein GCM10009304_27600 [Pseudomonas matsuisoli]